LQHGGRWLTDSIGLSAREIGPWSRRGGVGEGIGDSCVVDLKFWISSLSRLSATLAVKSGIEDFQYATRSGTLKVGAAFSIHIRGHVKPQTVES
jgi:hypothetical protein